ncbi:MAG: hypothetical protein JZD41_00415 [Thermoproteus sp.]|nr:hypothetical protein [Thermoproteus sp.]
MAKKKEEGGKSGKEGASKSKLEGIKDEGLGVLAATVLCLKRGCTADGPEVAIGPATFRLCEDGKKTSCEKRQASLLDLAKGKNEKVKRHKEKESKSDVATKKDEKTSETKSKKGQRKKSENKSNGGINILSFAGDGAADRKEIAKKAVDTSAAKPQAESKQKELVKPSADVEKDKKVVEEKPRGSTSGEERTAEVKSASQEAKTAAVKDGLEPISSKRLIEPVKKVLGIDENAAEKLLNTALGYLSKYPSVGILRFMYDISKLTKTEPDLVKKLLNVLKAYDVVEVHEMGVVNLIRPAIVEVKTSI